jgi:hypothetical protein
MSKSEYEKMAIATQFKVHRTGGFEGCANFGKGCDFGGYYLCKYSKEGLCMECELEKYPERFNGCRFCGKAGYSTFFCRECKEGFKNWMIKLFYDNQKDNKIKMESKKDSLLEIIKKGSYLMTCQHPEKLMHLRVKELTKLYDVWPGFHLGNNKHLIPDPLELSKKIDISDITSENCSDVMLRELKKINIFPFEDIQILPI